MNTQNKIKKLPLSSDVVFKSLFAKEKNKELLKSLLEAILKIKIKNIIVKNPEIPRDLIDSKAGVLDIKAEIDDKIIIDIEMQARDENNIGERSAFYLVSTASNEIKKGEVYIDMKKTIAINILNFNYFERNSYLNIARMKFEPNTDETYVDMGYSKEEEIATSNLEMVFLEIPKFLHKKVKADNILYQWLMLIAGKEEELKMSKEIKKQIKEAMERIDEMNMDPEEWELYESRQKAIINYNSGIVAAEKKGREEGEKKNKIEIAKRMLKMDMSIEQIIKITELTKEEIENLKKTKDTLK